MSDVADGRAPALGGFRRFMWWSLAATNAAILIVLIGIWILDAALRPWLAVASVVGLGATVSAVAVMFTRRLATAPPTPRVWAVVGGVGSAGLAAIMLADGDDGLWTLPPAVMVSAVAVYLPPARRPALLLVAASIAAALGAVATRWSDVDLAFAVLFPPAMVASLAWITLGMLWAWDLAARLSQARRLAAELAVKDERLRFAADLHDIQGHHLQVIALKSELAARLAESDPIRAAAEMKEVRGLAADALHDTRAVVQGYRRTTLGSEISNAANLLAAAGIDTTMDVESDDGELPEANRHLLGLVMREATTNLLRHSRAQHADVAYTTSDGIAWLRITNDGATASTVDGGTGLAGLAERLSAADGTLTWTRQGQRFVLTASLPTAVGREER